MPINSCHPEYAAHLSQWQRCRDAVTGSDAIKDRGTVYLPKLSEQSDDEYTAYKMRALWYGASARTVQGLTGAVMRKEPTVEVSTGLEDHLKDVTLSGVSFTGFAKTALEEVLKVGRYGVVVDMPKEGHETQRPFYAGYTAESIVNWKTAAVSGIHQLTLVVLRERIWSQAAEDQYVLELIDQYRVLRLNDVGNYEQEIFRENATKKGEWVSQGIIIPTFRKQPFTFIPFCFFGPNTITPTVEKPPILDLVDVNLSHYRTSADLEHGAHFCGLPTPWVAGFPESTVLKIGSSTAWVSTSPDAKAGMLEFTGQGLNALEARAVKKEQQMAVLGARLLEESKSSVEAADTLQVRHAGEQSVLRSVAGTVGVGLSKVLGWAGIWSGINPEQAKKATAKLNMDFMDTAMTFDEAVKLMSLWQSGAISYETFYYNLQKGELTRPGVDWKKEKVQVEKEAPDPIPQDQPPDPALMGA